MPDLLPALLPLAAFALALVALALLSRQIAVTLQSIVYNLTHSLDLATFLLFLILLPGVFVHESAHWAAARLLGLKTSRFRVWPRRYRNTIGLGQVTVQRGGPLRDSLVGMAPLLVGLTIILLIAQRVFGAETLSTALALGDWRGALRAMGTAVAEAQDAALWAYLLFCIANAMMPSASDREPLKPVLLTIALAAVLYIVLGLPSEPLSSVLGRAIPALQSLTSALLIVIVLDVAILVVLFLLDTLIAPSRRSNVGTF